jgi:hypothetical protein
VGPSDDEFNRVSFLSHFDGANNGVNNVFDDGSSSNHTITANGNATQGSFGPFARPDGEWGVSFDGSGDYLSVPDSSDFELGTGDFTIAMWLFPIVDGSGYQSVISHASHSGTVGWSVWYQANKLQFFVNAASTTYLTSGTFAANEWTHVAVVRTGNTLKLFINGDEDLSTSFSNFNNSTTTLTIGASPNWNTTYYYTGIISNVLVLKGTALYTGDFTPPTSKYTAITNTKLLTCQSNRFVDNSASGHTVTPSGNTAVTAFGPFLTSSVYDPAVNGVSAYMDGDGDYLSFPDSADWDFGTGDFTVEGWVNPASDLASDTQFIGFGDGDNGGNFGFEGTGQPYFYHGGYYARTSTALNLGSWSHIAFVRSSGTLTCYINGTSAASSSYTGNVGGSLAPRVGAYSGGQYFKGYMQDVRILKGTAVYTSAFTPPTAPLTAITNTKLLLNMADGQAIDSAAQGNLTLAGTAKTSTAQKKFGTASLLLDGNSDYVAIPAINLTNSFTMEFFAYLNAWPNSSNFDMFYGQASSVYMCFTSGINGSGSDRSIQLAYDPSGYSGITQFNVNSAMNSGAWHHVAITKNSSNVHVCYIDGTAVPATNATKANTFFTTGTHFIGRGYSPSYHYFGGYIDDFRISQLVRYTSNFTAPSEPFADKGQ